MIPRYHENAARAPLQDLAHGIHVPPPVDQIAGADIIIGLDPHQSFESTGVAVDIGEDEQLHGFMLPGCARGDFARP